MNLEPDTPGGLGNVFDAVDGDADGVGTRGDDLRAAVDVPRWALGDPEGYRVSLPAKIGEVDRVVQTGDETSLPLYLPETFPEGGTLRLRGQGGVGEDGGPAGDLYLVVRLTDEAPPPGALARRAEIERAVANIGTVGGGGQDDSEPEVFLWILGLALLGAIGFMLFV